MIESVVFNAKSMSVSPSTDVRVELLVECVTLFAEMRELAQSQWFRDNKEFILKAVDEYEAGVRAQAESDVSRMSTNRQDWDGGCPKCGRSFAKVHPLPKCKEYADIWVFLCTTCEWPFLEAHRKLRGPHGFCTDAI